MFTHISIWRVMVIGTTPVIAIVLVWPPAPVTPELTSIAIDTDRAVADAEPNHALEIVNPNLASIEFDFEPAWVLPELELDVADPPQRASDSELDLSAPATPLQFEMLDGSPASYHILTRLGRPLLRDHFDPDTVSFRRAAETGWADGISQGVVSVPFLKWNTDQRSAFSIGISHHSDGEETDLGVMGRWSVDF